MLNIDLLQKLLIISTITSVISCAFIQKSKGIFKTSRFIGLYSFIINTILGIVFCATFTKIDLLTSLWVGLFSFVGADSLYKALEDKLNSHADIINKNTVQIPVENIIDSTLPENKNV